VVGSSLLSKLKENPMTSSRTLTVKLRLSVAWQISPSYSIQVPEYVFKPDILYWPGKAPKNKYARAHRGLHYTKTRLLETGSLISTHYSCGLIVNNVGHGRVI
jgi:hypothetical protein